MARPLRKSGAALERRSNCPIACALDVVGDRWTLLVIRDIFYGKSRYGEFVESPEHVPTNILAERLQRLEQLGLIERKPYQKNPPRYEYSLTPKGEGLLPVLGALGTWGMQNLPDTKPNEKIAAMLRARRPTVKA